jgi:elongation factor G
MGDVIGNLNAKRGHIDGIDEHGTSRVIHSRVPLAEMFGYATELRSMTQGRATYSMEFSRYAQVPTNLANELIAKSKS